MDIKNKNLKAGNENGIIIAILAILLVLVLVIVGTVVLKDNAAVAKFDGGKVTKKEYQVYYEMFSSYLKSYGYDSNSIPEEIYEKSEIFIDNGYMTKTENGIALTRKGFLMSNTILSEIL